jgi:DNA-binding transcriptional ArsR family regulator
LKRYQDIADPSLAKALAHPMRTRILSALESRTASPSELADELEAPLGVVSYHVRRLHALHFLKLVKRVARRGAVEHYYTTVAGPTITDIAWGSAPTIVKRAMIGATLNTIAASVGDAVNSGGFDQAEIHVSRTPILVDEQGWKEVARELEALLGRIEEIETQSQRRRGRSDDDEDEQQATVVLMLYNSASVNSTDGSAGNPSDGRSRRADGQRGRSRHKADSRT